MRFDEGTKPCLPQYIRQKAIAVQLVISLDQAPALANQGLRQKAEVRTLGVAFSDSHLVCNPRHAIHGFAPRPANRLRSIRGSITIRDIYLRWMVDVVFIGKK